MRRVLIGLVVVWALPSLGCRATERNSERPRRRPNVLFLLADDQRADTLGAWGNEHIETPTLDRLVAEGLSFRRGYCLGSPHGAVCVPSRAMIHTGIAYHRLNLQTFDDRPTLGGLLGEAGYRTYAVGKWHNGRESLARSFQAAGDVMLGGMSDHHQVPLHDLVDGEFVNARTGVGHSSEIFANRAIDFLERHENDEPFFLYVAFTAPHDPRDPPPALRSSYDPAALPLPANYRPQHGFDNGFLTVRDEQLGAWPRTPALVRAQLAEYYALITHLDAQIGRILDTLDERGFAENTLVVYAADHGLAMGSHGLLGKQSLYEHSMRTPILLRGPGLPVGAEEHTLVYLHDLFPTILGQVGLPAPRSRTSRDLAPLWRGERSQLRDAVFTSMGKTQRALTTERWKLIRYPAIDRTQLFDLANDPHELENLADAPEHAALRLDLEAELQAWQRRVEDPLPWTADTLRTAEVDLTGQEREPDRWQPEWIRSKYFAPPGADGSE